VVPTPTVAATPASTPPAPVAAAAAQAIAVAPPSPLRFTLELGPFGSTTEAERVERQLTQAGLSTTRVRQPGGAALYAVLIERLAGAAEAETLVSRLHEQGYADAVVARREPPVVRVGEPLPLRRAVELAERLRAAGQQVRVAVQPGEAVAYTLRHGSFASKGEAQTRAAELGRLGLASQVIQVR
jgi:cell division protein FtsN